MNGSESLEPDPEIKGAKSKLLPKEKILTGSEATMLKGLGKEDSQEPPYKAKLIADSA